MIDFSKPCESFEQACEELSTIILGCGSYKPWSHHCKPYPMTSFDRARVAVQGQFPRYAALDAPRGPDIADVGSFSDNADLLGMNGPLGSCLDFSRVMIEVSPPFFQGTVIYDGLVLSRVRARAVVDVRRQILPKRYELPHVFEIAHLESAIVGGGKRAIFSRNFYELNRDGSVFRCTMPYPGHKIDRGNVRQFVLVYAACDRILRERYDWNVAIGCGHGASFMIPVERQSAREVFRLRDIPDGAQRRAALIHFVTKHWRRKPSQKDDSDPDVLVREHLRGETKFNWNGLRCEIVPPAYDVERLRGEKELTHV